MSLDISLEKKTLTEVWSGNITHNLNNMAEEAGLYKPLWRPEEVDLANAGQLIPILEKGISKLEADPDTYKALNPDNGWGDYEGLLSFCKGYLEACKEHPDARIRARR